MASESDTLSFILVHIPQATFPASWSSRSFVSLRTMESARRNSLHPPSHTAHGSFYRCSPPIHIFQLKITRAFLCSEFFFFILCLTIFFFASLQFKVFKTPWIPWDLRFENVITQRFSSSWRYLLVSWWHLLFVWLHTFFQVPSCSLTPSIIRSLSRLLVRSFIHSLTRLLAFCFIEWRVRYFFFVYLRYCWPFRSHILWRVLVYFSVAFHIFSSEFIVCLGRWSRTCSLYLTFFCSFHFFLCLILTPLLLHTPCPLESKLWIVYGIAGAGDCGGDGGGGGGSRPTTWLWPNFQKRYIHLLNRDSD